jgi:DNA polymerase I
VSNLTALIDSDTPVFSTALVSEDVDLPLAKSRLDYNINRIIEDSGCSEYKLFVSGKGNFRKEIDPSYKLHRADKPTPKWREDLRLHLLYAWGAIECNGYEADDACGIHQCSGGSTIICGIDKDLLQIPGKHYQWPIIRKGEIVRPALYHDIDEETGWRNLFTQALTGDTADNIKGVHGIGPKKAEKILEGCHTEGEFYTTVYTAYTTRAWMDDDATEETETQRFFRNCDMLYIWRELGITYSIRRETMGDW